MTLAPDCAPNRGADWCAAHNRSLIVCEAVFEERLACAALVRSLRRLWADDTIADAILTRKENANG